jgi:hypothetical protein
MTFQGAVIKEQGVEFAVVIVREAVLNNPSESSRVIASFQPLFPGLPVALMAQDSRGVPTYRGRQDIVNFLASVPIEAIPWSEFTVS